MVAEENLVRRPRLAKALAAMHMDLAVNLARLAKAPAAMHMDLATNLAREGPRGARAALAVMDTTPRKTRKALLEDTHQRHQPREVKALMEDIIHTKTRGQPWLRFLEWRTELNGRRYLLTYLSVDMMFSYI